nr:alanine racemase [candidate division Zixibacteria bacterium]
MKKEYLSWVELDSGAFKNNIGTIRKLAEDRMVAVAVKANAYGHGLAEITSLLIKEDIRYIAVHSLEEAMAARQYGWDREILVVGYIPLVDLGAVIDLNLEPTVYNRETVSRLGRLSQKYGVKINLHLKLETGTNRQGVEPERLPRITDIIKKYSGLHLKGVSTHFANIEDTTNHAYARYQLDRFNKTVGQLRKMGFKPELRHTACSAAMLLFDDTRFELVRPGIAVYGLWPSKETYLSYRLMGGSNNILKPVMKWKTRVIQIKDVLPDAFVGYGCTYRTTSKTRLAVLPVGYYDGYDRQLSNTAHVLIKGRRAPIRGRVCMNLMMVDITDIKGVRLEDEVVLMGNDGTENVSADQIAAWASTVNYEIVSRINGSIVRKII